MQQESSPYDLNLSKVDPVLRAILEKTPHLERAVKRYVWNQVCFDFFLVGCCLTFLLLILQFVNPGPEHPFSSDLEFINLIDAIFELRDAYHNLEDAIKSAHSELVPKQRQKLVRFCNGGL